MATWVEWGIRYGDGEIDGGMTKERATRKVRAIRQDIGDGHFDATDYEPMLIVCRTVTRTVTPWEDQ